MKAIAAMSLNRVIGRAGQIPWHLPEDFRWFKRVTTGHVVLMGRKTYESIGKPLPDRTNIVLTRRPAEITGVTVLHDLSALSESSYAPREIFVIGGADLYQQLLPKCRELYLSVVQREVEGDAFFPPFEDRFELLDVPLRAAEFEVRHYRNLHA
ncbi:MAG: dihydrofolate reductase [Chthoniobacter sp.]|nr:dihydrofolate reductase [Chthoniobacter sp.]